MKVVVVMDWFEYLNVSGPAAGRAIYWPRRAVSPSLLMVHHIIFNQFFFGPSNLAGEQRH